MTRANLAKSISFLGLGTTMTRCSFTTAPPQALVDVAPTRERLGAKTRRTECSINPPKRRPSRLRDRRGWRSSKVRRCNDARPSWNRQPVCNAQLRSRAKVGERSERGRGVPAATAVRVSADLPIPALPSSGPAGRSSLQLPTYSRPPSLPTDFLSERLSCLPSRYRKPIHRSKGFEFSEKYLLSF